MDFKVEGAMEHLKVMLVTMDDKQEKFLNSRLSRMTKTLHFNLGDSLLRVFALNFFYSSFFCHTKKCVCVGGGLWPTTYPWCRQPCINAYISFELIMTDKLLEQNKTNTYLSIFGKFI